MAVTDGIRAKPGFAFAIMAVVFVAVAGAAALLPGDAEAAAGSWSRADMVAARLVAAVDGAGATITVPLGVEIQLEPGWKTYWRSPGDAGLPPRLDWSGSANLAGVEIAWPAPSRFTLFGLETFGYERELVLPVTARRTDQAQPLEIKAGLDLLVCHDICVPVHFDLSLSLTAGPATPAPEAELIARHARRVPGDGAAVGLTVLEVRAAGTSAAPALEVEVTAREPFVSPDLFVESKPPMVFKAPELHFDRSDRHLTAQLALDQAGKAPPMMIGSLVTVTLVDGNRSIEATATIKVAASTAAVPDSGSPGLLSMLATALLGGLVLNLMPCVLPVLSLKLLSVMKHGGGSSRAVRADFLASAAGILFSFLVLALVMIGLKMAGAAVGWGIQFQQPLFLGAMALVVALFALNLWGLFEIPLPRFIADAAAADSCHPGKLAAPFMTGAFATLLATPCSAPFLGTAIGFALAREPLDILAVFAMLGLGLALPYLLVAAMPRLVTVLPRPGRWMLGLRRVLGLALAATALWLVSMLATQIVPTISAPGQAATADAEIWLPFDSEALRKHLAAGAVVLVDVTADWCLTCIANKRFVLDRPDITDRLRDVTKKIVAMRADWTRPDIMISHYLASFGRYGIPFNAVYGPGAPRGLALPELLSIAAVLEGLARARSDGT
ncbi:MAG: protein-disulfide reductase DsbD domain-containing protein [Rhodospirillaceae bacterium]